MRDTNHKIREALQTNVPAWDKEEVWHTIEPHLPKRKSKRRMMIWWWAGSLTVIGFFVLLGWQNMAEAEKGSSQQPLENVLEKSIPSADNDTKKESAATNADADFNDTSLKQDPSSPTGKTKKSPLSDKKQTAPLPTYNKNVVQPSRPTSAKDSGTHRAPDNTIHQVFHNADRQESSGFVVLKTDQKTEIRFVAESVVSGLPGRQVFLSMATIPFLTPVVHDKKSGFWLVSLESGIADIDKSYKILNPAAQNWSDHRRRVTSPKESVHAGFRVFRVLPNQIRIGLGLQYQRIQEVVTARDVTQSIREVPSDSAFYYTGLSGTEYFSGNIREIRTTGFSIYSPNALTRWSVPLEIGYTINAGRFSLIPSAGLMYSIYQQYQGIHPGPDGKYIYKNKEATDALYQTSGQLSWSAALDVRLITKGSIEAGLGVFYVRDLTSSLRPETQLDERYIQKGIRLRLVKKW